MVVDNLPEANIGFASCLVPESSLLEYPIYKSAKEYFLMVG